MFMPRTLSAAFIVAAGLTALAPLPASAQSESSVANEPGTITVTGEGTAKKAPDMAVITLTVLRQGETARAALDANNSAMGSVLSAMESDGIAEKDLQTSGFSIKPRYATAKNKDSNSESTQIVGYQVTNTLSVRIHDLSKVGDILDQSVSLGVNQGGNIRFTNEDPSAPMSEARKSAMNDAISKAKALTQAANVELGPIKLITEETNSMPPAPMAMMRAKQSGPVPIQSGENEFQVTVNVTWEIKQ
ncbi:SIMPL domain-containing protein [Pararhizobium mangrovi]|uniref:SIMPL domain-containing protein n=1 Tax=Pararhizobium mangrovi TaxID=2590452 RepID=A0A506U8Y2_9HYPH|nr:SIMPL domain-containing protein [Pararhizobium mangrovi]TPW30350.1 SIMPL domain-containing protein [Pararhizobium mangrovi]